MERNMALVNNLDTFHFPFDFYVDRNRFQYISTNMRHGFYDSIEKKFITSEILFDFLQDITPSKCEVNLDDRLIIEKIKHRIEKNMSTVIKRPVESYTSIFLKYVSNRFLKSKDCLTAENAILFVDIVGSTELTLKLLPLEISTMIRAFSQEMAILISKHGGFVLKYAGDAVIGYFPTTINIQTACENSVRCAESIHKIISKIFGPVLQEFDLKPIQVRVGIEFGGDSIMFFGTDGDLIGSTITSCSKIYPCADPSHTAIGYKIYENLNKKLAERFIPLKSNSKTTFLNPVTKKPYQCYVSK